ncbi:transcriptional activator [Leuconostoc citreum]|uniref:transcriptional activator n=1 Tax=Leuconostoc citreum TaxID=33964 RepID=UPI0030C6CCED
MEQREYEISNDRGPSDENIGGGKPLNKHNRPVENMRIRIDEDSCLNKQKEDIERWIATFEPVKQKVVKDYYASKTVTWTKVAQQFHIAESTAKSWRVEVKHILGSVL